MIDTDKYEGHTPAPWKAHNALWPNGIDENNLSPVTSFLQRKAFRRTWGVTLSEERLDDDRANRIGYDVMHIADAQLIADAPLLLAEVKQLREVINKAMQQHTVLEMRGQLFESECIDAEGQYESGQWERDEE